MSGPPSDSLAQQNRLTTRPPSGSARRGVLVGVVTFLISTVAAFIAMRAIVWSAVKRVLVDRDIAEVVAVTPWDVIVTQAWIAVLVGLVFGAEAFLYVARDALAPGRWWTGDPLPREVRAALVLLGAALFPVGAMLGYRAAFPVVVESLTESVAIGRLLRIAAYVSIAAGLAAQSALVGGVLAFDRLRPAN